MRARQQGFTLLEILVATTILGFAVVGLLSSLSDSSMRNATHVTDRATARHRWPATGNGRTGGR